MSDGLSAVTQSPQLRTLLLTDLCDSTGLVERLGDASAAKFFRQHDHFVLELQQRWRGRLIDRSDGMLLLFERPLDGLGFALDYRRGLEELGKSHCGLPLKARSGLHVGEVLIWRNSPDAIQAGAKAIDIEGLAKPLAARLMQVARPGQILLSSVAEPLLRRAASELGERGQRLEWRCHGPWRLRGLPEVLNIYEVGEPGLAPLRMPRGDAKARRDLPLWRRPAALVAEVFLVLVVGLGSWMMTRPEPAIAFSERDWVVLADVRNMTNQSVLDASLGKAVRISLEQSRYVNVLSDMKVDQTLGDMRLDPKSTVIDRAVASQVALRDGARAVVLPTIRELKGQLQLVVEVIDPSTQTTVYSVQEETGHLDSVLPMIDTVVARLRGQLGEALANVRKDAVPLPRETTSDLNALRAYALAETAMSERRYDEAANLYKTAVQIDPAFTRARLGLVSLAWAGGEVEQAQEEFQQVLSHLSKSASVLERLTVEAWSAQLSADGDPLPKWQAIASLFPDNFTSQHNASWHLLTENRFEEAMAAARAGSVLQAPLRTITLLHVARIHNARGQPQLAMEVIEEATRRAREGAVALRAESHFLLGNAEQARSLLSKVQPESGTLALLIAQQGLVSIALAEGRSEEALALSRRMEALAADLTAPFPLHYSLMRLEVSAAVGAKVTLAELVQLEGKLRLAALDDDAPRRHESLFRLVALAYVAQRVDQRQLAGRIIAWVEPMAEQTGNRMVAKLLVPVRANQARLEGRVDDARRMLEAHLDGNEFYLSRVVMHDIALAAQDTEQARVQQGWLWAHRGQAFAEVSMGQLLQPINVAAAWGRRGELQSAPAQAIAANSTR